MCRTLLGHTIIKPPRGGFRRLEWQYRCCRPFGSGAFLKRMVLPEQSCCVPDAPFLSAESADVNYCRYSLCSAGCMAPGTALQRRVHGTWYSTDVNYCRYSLCSAGCMAPGTALAPGTAPRTRQAVQPAGNAAKEWATPITGIRHHRNNHNC
jgi:hypothetical protein